MGNTDSTGIWAFLDPGARKRYPRVLRVVFFGLNLILFSAVAAPLVCAEDSGLADAPKTFSVSGFRVPEAVGHVSEVLHAQQRKPGAPSIVLIQDAHINYDAQINIARIVEALAKDYGMKLVLAEGREGNVSLAYMRPVASVEIRRKVGEEFLREGWMSGYEYLDYASDLPLIVWGIDDKALYEANYAAFMKLEELRKSADPELESLAKTVESLAAARFGAPLVEFRAKSRAFDEGKLQLSDYVKAIADIFAERGLSLENYPHLARMREADEKSSGIDLAAVSKEQRETVNSLRDRASNAEMDALGGLAKQAREGGSSEAFYLELRRLIDAHSMALATAPALGRYLDLLKLRSEIQAKALWLELDRAAADARKALCASDDERRLLAAAEAVALHRKLLALKWVPGDYRRFVLNRKDMALAKVYPEIEKAAREASLAIEPPADPAALDAQLAEAVGFYDAAQARNAKMAENVLDKMREEGVSLAAMVVGGFHTDALTGILVDRGADVVIVTPVVGADPGDEAKYRRVMRIQSVPWTPVSDLERRLGTARQRHAASAEAGTTTDSR